MKKVLLPLLFALLLASFLAPSAMAKPSKRDIREAKNVVTFTDKMRQSAVAGMNAVPGLRADLIADSRCSTAVLLDSPGLGPDYTKEEEQQSSRALNIAFAIIMSKAVSQTAETSYYVAGAYRAMASSIRNKRLSSALLAHADGIKNYRQMGEDFTGDDACDILTQWQSDGYQNISDTAATYWPAGKFYPYYKEYLRTGSASSSAEPLVEKVTGSYSDAINVSWGAYRRPVVMLLTQLLRGFFS